MRRPGLVSLLVVIAAFCVLVSLGVWQLQRLQWKTALLQSIAAAQHGPAEPLDAVLRRVRDGVSVDFVRVQVDCLRPDPPPAHIYLYGLQDGRIGWRQIAPCRIASDGFEVIAVDRGFAVGAGDAARPPATDPPPPRRVVGVLREPEAPNRILEALTRGESAAAGYRSRAHALEATARAARVRTAPVMLVAEREDPARPGLRAAPLPVDIPNSHLGYAITWFGLAAALAGVYLAMLFRRRPS